MHATEKTATTVAQTRQAIHRILHRQDDRQLDVIREVVKKIANGEQAIIGAMIESNLIEGNQSLESYEPLVYGKSVTDGFIDWKDTKIILRQLADAV